MEESFPISEQGYTSGKLLDETECQILLDTGASKTLMSKSYYMHCKSLHSFTKICIKDTENSGRKLSVYYCIIYNPNDNRNVHGHRFEIYTLVSEIYENIDIVLGIKNAFKLGGVINSWDCCLQIFEQIHTHLSKRTHHMLKPKEQKLIKVKAPFMDEISGLAIIKILGRSIYNTMLLKLKFMCNAAALDIVNNDIEAIMFKPEDTLGIVDLRSLDYYKIKHGILQQNLSKYYRVDRADTLCEHFNKFYKHIDKRKENQRALEESYPWLDPSDERKYMRDQEILDKYINLEKSCLTEKEKKELMEVLYKYKETFSLRR